ncbi:hypothetical protein [Bacillus sp. JJ722]|uniref:hypothetical protein n=1 Tax=Bacillus sp. JJ722 TaxID=3122973 RepID=UPI002FFF116B
MNKHQIVGERNEEECMGPINSGLFSAMLAIRDSVHTIFQVINEIDYEVLEYSILMKIWKMF